MISRIFLVLLFSLPIALLFSENALASITLESFQPEKVDNMFFHSSDKKLMASFAFFLEKTRSNIPKKPKFPMVKGHQFFQLALWDEAPSDYPSARFIRSDGHHKIALNRFPKVGIWWNNEKENYLLLSDPGKRDLLPLFSEFIASEGFKPLNLKPESSIWLISNIQKAQIRHLLHGENIKPLLSVSKLEIKSQLNLSIKEKHCEPFDFPDTIPILYVGKLDHWVYLAANLTTGFCNWEGGGCECGDITVRKPGISNYNWLIAIDTKNNHKLKPLYVQDFDGVDGHVF